MDSNNNPDIQRETIIVEMPTAPALARGPQAMLAMAKTFIIDSPEMAQEAASELGRIKARWNQLEEQRTSIVAPALQIQRNTNALFKEPMETLKQAETIIKQAIGRYQEAERQRIERERRAAEEAARIEREKVEAEARKRQAEAEAQARAAREAEEAAERALQAEMEAARRGDEEAAAKARAEADAAEQSRLTAVAMEAHAQAEAQTLELTAAVTTAAAPATTATRLAGVSSSKPWKARVTDKAALLRFIADNPEYLDWVDVKMTGLNGLAKAQKGAMRVPGAEAYQDIVIGSRAA
jgi:membrane protein involved in colicin uptake